MSALYPCSKCDRDLCKLKDPYQPRTAKINRWLLCRACRGFVTPGAEALLFELGELIDDVHALARAKDWWSPDQDHIAIKAERVHCEVSELCDVFARGTDGDPDKDCPSHTKAEIEWADCILRLSDIAGRYGFRPSAILAKLEFNRTRPIRHGGKKF